VAHSPKEIREILSKAGPYPLQAYEFVRQGLAHTVATVHGEGESAAEESRHVSGQQLCLGLRDFALRRYGMLARTVLGRWGIHKTDDFGAMVFALIDAGLLRKTDEDSLDDFRAVYDFHEAFSSVEA